MWLNDEHLRYPNIEYNDLSSLSPDSLLSLPSGVYYADLNLVEEGHMFVWIIINDTLIYCGGYGGALSIVVECYNKHEYIKRFIEAMNGNFEAYIEVFNIETVYIQSVTFEWLSLERSLRYY